MESRPCSVVCALTLGCLSSGQGWNPTVQDPQAAPPGDAGECPGQRAGASTSHSCKFPRHSRPLPISEVGAHQPSWTVPVPSPYRTWPLWHWAMGKTLAWVPAGSAHIQAQDVVARGHTLQAGGGRTGGLKVQPAQSLQRSKECLVQHVPGSPHPSC